MVVKGQAGGPSRHAIELISPHPKQNHTRDMHRRSKQLANVLEELGAVTADGQLTDVGMRMARLPVDPRLARMVLAAAEHGCLQEILVITSALAAQDPRERPPEKQQQADQMHARFRHPCSDFMAWLALWRYYEEQRQALSGSQLAKLCKREFLAYMRMREWRDVHTQLSIACRSQQLRPRPSLPEEENYEGVHRALLAGFLSGDRADTTLSRRRAIH